MKLKRKFVSLFCMLSFLLVITLPKSDALDTLTSDSIKHFTFTENTIDETAQVQAQEEKYEQQQKSYYEEELKKEEEEKLNNQRRELVTYERSDMTKVSDITKEELINVFENHTSASTMTHLADAFIEAEEKYGVNAFAMAAIVALESSYATSRRAVEDNNLTGYEVYTDASEGKLFSSQHESVMQTAKHLANNYLTQGGTYYNGVAVDDVQVSYCPDEGLGKNWEGKVDSIASRFLEIYEDLYL